MVKDIAEEGSSSPSRFEAGQVYAENKAHDCSSATVVMVVLVVVLVERPRV